MLESVEATDLDRPIYGAKNIGAVVNLSERQAFHALERGYLDGDKFGKKWRSTKRRLLKPATSLTAAPAPSPDRTDQHIATESVNATA
jgi:hypothetical protein